MASFQTILLNDVCDFEKGTSGLTKATPGEYPLVTTGAERRTCESFQFDTEAVCIPLVSSTGHGHASLKNVHYQEGKFALGSILVALTAKDKDVLNIQFLHLYLSQLKDVILVPLMSGAANVALSVGKIKTIEIPLPSIGRQGEIVSQFKSIVAEEDELKCELTYQQSLLKKLRQQILQEAIEGKLTADWRAQNPDIEPASELLARIKAEKEHLVKEKKIKKQKPLPPIREEEKPFELPEGWGWCRLGDLTSILGDGLHGTPTFSQNGEYYFVNGNNLSDGTIEFKRETKRTTNDEFKKHKKELNDRTVLVSINGTLGNVAYYNGEKIILGKSACYFNLLNEISKPYIKNFVQSTYFIQYAIFFASETTIKNVSLRSMRLMPIPLPAPFEQKAIVDKVEKLFALCDQLETQINQNQNHAEQLMQAVLKEAFSQKNEQAEPVAVKWVGAQFIAPELL